MTEHLKALGAAAASSGAVALFHMIGVTPEALTVQAAFQNKAPKETVYVTLADLRSARRELTTGPSGDAADDKLDMVVLGSPHFSLAEFRQLAALLSPTLMAGKRCHQDVQFLVTTSRAVVLLAKQAGCLGVLEEFGGRVTVDTCILASPMLPPQIKRLMTNSAKYAYYAPGMLGTRVAFGSLSDCVESAVAGRIVRDDTLWSER